MDNKNNKNAKGAAKNAPKQNRSPASLAQLKAELMREIRRSAQQNNQSGTKMSAPVAMARVRRGIPPQIKSVQNGDCVISHTEYFSDLAGSIAFASNSFAINPGLLSTFPWLSAIAQRFESYHFEELEFRFDTEAATSTTGTVLLALDFDASDAAPGTKAQALSFRSHVRSAPWEESKVRCLLEDLSKRKSYYVRNGSLSSNQDIKLYDTGNLFACTQAQAGTTVVGELSVRYRVRLMTPQTGSLDVNEALWATFSGTSNAAPAATKVGNLPATASSSGTTTSVTTFTFTAPWRGLVSTVLVGTGLTNVTPSGTGTSSEVVDVLNAASTTEAESFSLDIDAGQTAIITSANTTISASRIDFAQGGQ